MTHERSPAHRALYDNHHQLDDLFAEVVHAAEAGVDKRTLGEIWTRFVTAVRSHLALEEELVFPALETKHPAEILDFRAVHDRIRSMLDTLDVAVDLHFIRAREVKDLVDLIGAHAIAEDASLYLWAESEIETTDRSRLLQRLRDQWSSTTQGAA